MKRSELAHRTACLLRAHNDGAPCPDCGRARVWRIDDAGRTVCGTGADSGRAMSPAEPCYSCRQEYASPLWDCSTLRSTTPRSTWTELALERPDESLLEALDKANGRDEPGQTATAAWNPYEAD